MAKTSGADVIGFNVKLDNGVMGDAKHLGINVYQNNIIYEIIDLVKENMATFLNQKWLKRKQVVLKFDKSLNVSKGRTVAGSMVMEGR